MEILVANVVEPVKWGKNKQLVAYIFARCIAPVTSLPLLTGFVVQSLLA